MRAKACTRCRQWKVRCDAGENNQERCTRCHNIDSPCVFDSGFKRVPRDKALAALHAEVQRLTRLRERDKDVRLPTEPSSSTGVEKTPIISTTSSDGRGHDILSLNQNETAAFISHYDPSLVNTQLHPPLFEPCVSAKRIGDLVFTAAQVNELFRVFYTRCHAHLPFSITKSIEEVYSRSTLLFWAICAVASDTKTSGQLMPYVQWLIQDVLRPPHNVQTVQGLLLICTWPSPFSTQSSDPSSLYAALAVQIGYTIGLHRPTMADEFTFTSDAANIDVEMRRTTWMACFIVNQIQSTRRGVPMSIAVDHTILRLVEDQIGDPTLATLFHIAILSDRASTTIGACADNLSGLLEPNSRVHMVKLFSSQFDSLRNSRQPEKNEITEMAFLGARLQLWSFILLDDVPATAEMPALIFHAEKDATRLIQIGCERNLSLVPFHVCRTIVCGAVILIKILKSPFATHYELLRDHIDRARLALSSASRSEGDAMMNVCSMLSEAPKLESKQGTSIIKSRMSFSLICGFIRTFTEHLHGASLQHNINDPTSPAQAGAGEDPPIQFLDRNGINKIDLDGLSWDEFML